MISKIYDYLKLTKSAVFFVLLLLCIDFAGTHFLANQFTRNAESVSYLLRAASPSITWFLFRLFVLSYVLSVFLSIFEKLIQLKRKFFFYLLLFGYVIFLLLVRTPQIFDDWLLNSILPMNRKNWNSDLIMFLSIVLFALLNFQLFRAYRLDFFKRIQFYAANGMALIFLISNYSTLGSNEVTNSGFDHLKKLSAEQKKENIIAVLIDSLPHNKEQSIKQHANSSVLNFLKTSQSFKNVFSDLPQTHGALYSFFSGQGPHETGVRYAYHSSSLSLGSIDLGSLNQLKEKGYEIHIIADVMETSPWTPGRSIDSVYGPNFGFETSFISKIFYSKLFHGFFDNRVGEFFFPNLFYNNSFSFLYDAHDATMKNIAQMNKILTSSDKPKFILFHVCTLHIPGILKYPYYPKVGNNAMTARQFSYLFGFKSTVDSDGINNRGAFNGEVFASGAKILTKEVLNPLFEYFSSTELISKSNVLLFSDHGENLWEKNIDYPKVKIPFHGDTLLFSSNAEHSYLKASLINGQKINPEESISLSNVIGRIFLNKTYTSKFFYVETGFNPFVDFSGILKTATSALQSKYMNIDKKSGMIYIDPVIDDIIILEKQRAMLDDNYRYTIFPTIYGRKKFLCNLKSDPNCLTNIDAPALNQKYFLELKKIFEKDQAKNQDFAPSDALDPDCNIEQLNVALNSKNEWLKTYANMILFFKFHDFELATNNIFEIFNKTQDTKLVDFIKKNIGKFCTDQKSVNSLVGEMVFGRNSDNFINRTNHREFLLCADMFSRARTAEHNFDNAFAIIKESYPKYFKNNSITVTIDELEADFKIRLNYRIENELDGYYFFKFSLLKAQNKEQAFKFIMKELTTVSASKNFEILFFKYLEEHFKISDTQNIELQTASAMNRRKIRIDRINNFFRKMKYD
jgi:hypothetical protein